MASVMRSSWLSSLTVLALVLGVGCATEPGYKYAQERDALRAREGKDHISNDTVFPDEQRGTMDRVTDADRAALLEYRRASRAEAERAYQDGVRDTMEEFKGQMHGRSNFVWEPPLVEMVDMPTQVINGALVPAHKAPVIISPGRWVEHNNVQLPNDRYRDDRGNNDEGSWR